MKRGYRGTLTFFLLAGFLAEVSKKAKCKRRMRKGEELMPACVKIILRQKEKIDER